MKYEIEFSSWIGSEQGARLYVIVQDAADYERHPQMVGRSSVSLEAGPARFSLRPTIEEMRELAAILLAAADEQEAV